MTTADQSPSSTPEKHSPYLPLGPEEHWGGQDLKRACIAGAAWLTRNAEAINALNVFPVPDGDTGTNMALTMQAAVKNVADSPSHSASEIAEGISHGALMGARGNSGVILSQIWRGFAEGIAGKTRISAQDFAAGLTAATATAYRAVLKPVEGTILTVVRETSEGAKAAAADTNSFGHVLPEAVRAARASVALTPTLLDKLRDAGVVDAGGQGIFVLLDGIRRYAEGEDIDTSQLDATESSMPLASGSLPEVHVEHGEYGYCTNFLIVGGGWNFEEVRARMAAFGDSAVIVGDDRLIKVHIHTEEPGTVLNYATSLGSLRQIGITNMQDQHEDFLEMHGAASEDEGAKAPTPAVAQGLIGVLAVVSGEGLASAFRSMGASAVIEGGQTMNPSTEQFLTAIESLPQDQVILLPNNGNIIPVARQTPNLTKKRVVVVPTDTIAQGMAALIALNFDGTLEENAEAMTIAASAVDTGEITRAVRDAKVGGIDVKEGQVIGLLNNTLVATGQSLEEVAWGLLDKMKAGERELITVYWGAGLNEDEACAFRDGISERYPGAEVELVNGGQPFYSYIISAE